MADQTKSMITNEQARIIGEEVGRAVSAGLKSAIHEAVFTIHRVNLLDVLRDGIRKGFGDVTHAVREGLGRREAD